MNALLIKQDFVKRTDSFPKMWDAVWAEWNVSTRFIW